MKTNSLQLPWWRRMYVAGLDKKASAVAKEKEIRLHAFQRKAFTGNYFAGPHCLFDPRLFRDIVSDQS